MVNLLFIISLWLGCGGGTNNNDAPLPAGSEEMGDLVLISIDTLRADHLSSYGYERETSPFLDARAAEGVRFTDARSPSPWTLPAHTTMLTGLSFPNHLVVEDDARYGGPSPFVGQALAHKGFQTGGFVSTLYVSTRFGFDKGFAHFQDFDIHNSKKNLSGEVNAEDVIGEALEWARTTTPGKPIFLFIHLYDVHYGYDPPAPYDTIFDRANNEDDLKYRKYSYYKRNPVDDEQMAHQVAQYDEEIRYVDAQLERLHNAFEAAGRDSTWIVTSDHGEEFNERGSWGHAHTLYKEQLHVPFIAWGDRISSPRVVTQRVGIEDIAPTLAKWGGTALDVDGIDLRPIMVGGRTPPRSHVAETSRFATHRLSWLEGDWRLEWDVKTGQSELFNVAEDPAERNDVSDAHPERVESLRTNLLTSLGDAWEAKADATLATKGSFYQSGKELGRTLTVSPGDAFGVTPVDATVRLKGAGKGSRWRAAGGKRPGSDAPVALKNDAQAAGVQLSENERRRLEALGYIE